MRLATAEIPLASELKRETLYTVVSNAIMTQGEPSQTAISPGETSVREALRDHGAREAAELALRIYGPEVFGFIHGVVNDSSLGRDIYASFAGRVWRGLDGFRWHCSLRTWSYAIARNEIARHRARRSSPVPVPLSDVSSFVADHRSSKRTFEASSLHDALTLVRSELPPEDRELLILRVDRELSWRDIAVTLIGDAPDERLERESARVRQRFVSIKKQLAKAMRAKGIRPDLGHRDGKLEAENRKHGPPGRSRERHR